jgi:hypothetical protein
MLSEGNQILYTILYCVNFCDSILIRFRIRNLGFRFAKVRDLITVPVPVPLRQKVTVPVPVPRHCFQVRRSGRSKNYFFNPIFFLLIKESIGGL